MNQVIEDHQVSIIMDDEGISDSASQSSEISSNSNRFEYFVTSGFSEIDKSSREGRVIDTSISQNLSNLPMTKTTRIVAIHKNLNVSRSWRIRAQNFHAFTKAAADKCGGDSKVDYAWYGASLEEIREIVTHGFNWRMGDKHGVSFSPAKYFFDSVLSSTADESGLRHLLLCRIILGKQEVVTEASGEFYPSSPEFDSGVDNISDPRKLIVWNSRLNFSILPCYIVSIEAPCLIGVTGGKIIKPRSSLMTFPELISMLSPFIDPPKTVSLKKHYTAFQGKGITRPQLIQRVKEIAGERLLSFVLNTYKQGNSSQQQKGRDDEIVR